MRTRAPNVLVGPHGSAGSIVPGPGSDIASMTIKVRYECLVRRLSRFLPVYLPSLENKCCDEKSTNRPTTTVNDGYGSESIWFSVLSQKKKKRNIHSTPVYGAAEDPTFELTRLRTIASLATVVIQHDGTHDTTGNTPVDVSPGCWRVFN